jgi:hypothetical protein
MVALALAAGGVAVLPAPASANPPGVTPSDVTTTLAPGGSTVIAKTVHTAAVPPNPDIVLLADTTGSMGPAIDNVRTNAAGVLSAVTSAQPTAQFGVAEYKDVSADGPAAGFHVDQDITANAGAVQTGINAWVPDGGGDTPEDGLNALYNLATGAVTYRPGDTRIVVIFGDAPSHDPSNGHSLADTIAALSAAHVRVVAVNVGDLNNGGQIQSVTDATGGVFLDNVPSDQIANAIITGIQAIKVTVTPHVLGTCPVNLTYAPASSLVDSGTDAHFNETVTVPAGLAAGTYTCSVDFLVDGISQGFIQHLTVKVPGLSVNDVSVNEGAGQATFTVTLSTPSPTPVSVNYATANGTATAPADYTAKTGTLTFAPGEVTKNVSVPIVDDAVDEPNETYHLLLSAAAGAAITDGDGLGTIVDNDRNGTWSCSAKVLQVGPLTSTTANPANSPCVDDTHTLAQVNLTSGLVTVQATVLNAQTDLKPDNQSTAPAAGDGATAQATVKSTKIIVGLVTIEIGEITATAKATCVSGAPAFTGTSTIASIKINGVPVVVPPGSTPVTIPLVIGSLKLNATTTTATSVTQQAVVLHTLLTDVVLAQAHADVEGTTAHPTPNPCQV